MRTYIGYALNDNIRYQATSGGVGSSILKYLFESGQIQTAISFDYDSSILQYVPKFIYDYSEYVPVGSIYHEINIVSFLKDNIEKIYGTFACFVLPCQARTVRYLMKKSGHECYLLGLTCSSQQNIEATYYLLKRLKISKEDVIRIQYRGNGWPSGIQIHLKNGSKTFLPNNNSIWTQIFHSRLFIYPRCFNCNNTLNSYSDISLADPWLKEYINKKNEGYTLLMVNTENGEKLICEISSYCCIEKFDENETIKSQIMTIHRKSKYKERRWKQRILLTINRSSFLKSFLLSNVLCFNTYYKIKNYIER